jgi:NAD(P)-dependent dehydrogenase (short-subunit alcohol dehydrogenase family)
MMTDQSFTGRVALVTGAAGELGGSTAVRLGAAGASLALLDLRREGLDRLRDRLSSMGVRSVAVTADQSDREEVEHVIAGIVGGFGAIDAVFANAGYGQFSTFLETSAKNWSRHVNINLTGTFNVCQVVAAAMVDHGRGGAFVLNASSAAAVQCDHLSSYAATKAGVRMLALSMASELGVHRIRVNCIMPGVIETAMTRSMLQDARHRDVLESETPLGRVGQPDDIASLVTFLLSDDAAFITGASIPVDGGQTLHGHPRWFRLDYRNAHDEKWFIPA